MLIIKKMIKKKVPDLLVIQRILSMILIITFMVKVKNIIGVLPQIML